MRVERKLDFLSILRISSKDISFSAEWPRPAETLSEVAWPSGSSFPECLFVRPDFYFLVYR